MKRFLIVGVLLGSVSACAVMEDQPLEQREQELHHQQICAGIAGSQCPAGQRCVITDTYPDALGFCVGNSGNAGNPNAPDCSAVKCAGCAEGETAQFVAGQCCPICTPAPSTP